MADIDIDKMVEESIETEKKKETKNKLLLYVIIAFAVVAAGVILAFIINSLMGDKGADYLLLNSGRRITYNVKGGSPEIWSALEETKDVNGYECRVLNMVNVTNQGSKQEYYYISKEGVIRLAYSENFGKIKKFAVFTLPARMKKGKTFSAGKMFKKEIQATIEDEELISTPVDELEAYRVTYRSGDNMDKTVWYAKGYGVVKLVDRKQNKEMFLISVEDR